IQARIVNIPNLRPLIFRIPLAETVAKTEETFLGARFFLVPPRAADAAIEAEFLDGSEQGGNLQAIAADFAGSGNGDAFANGFFDGANDQARTEFFCATVAKRVQFREMMAG